jgi:uncharacterized protein
MDDEPARAGGGGLKMPTDRGAGPISCIYRGEVMHRRLIPMRHRFVYRVFSMLLDLDEIPALGRRFKLFSHNRWNLFGFCDKDHGSRDGEPVRQWIDAHLRRAGFDPEGFKVFIHCFPRVLGYVFNPLTIYFCYDGDNQPRAILYEVKNTFGEQHGYLIPVGADRQGGQPIVQGCDKAFHVSPFIDMAARYRFRLKEPGEKLSILIRQSLRDGETLLATHTARREALSDGALLRILATYPLMTAKVMIAIHWEALKLWTKGARYHSRPAPPLDEVSVILDESPGRETRAAGQVTN